MSNINSKWWEPDKIIKDLIWDDLVASSKYAKGKMLDVGCGDKPYYQIFKNKINSYTGIDKFNKNADIKVDFLEAKIENQSYDTVICTQVLEHIEDPKKLLGKINKILKKNGILILTVPFMGTLHEIPNDYYRFTRYSITKLLNGTGFKITYIKEEGNWISSIANLICFYLESTFNRYLIRYPKRVFIILIQYFLYKLSLLPSRFTKPELCPINYIVVASKK